MKNLYFLAGMGAAVAPALAQQTVTPLSVAAVSGQVAPAGREAPLYYKAFVTNPSVNAQGKMVFAASLSLSSGGATTVRGVFTDRGGTMQSVAFDDTPINTDYDPTRTWEAFSSSTVIFAADNGRLVVSSRVTPPFSSTSANSAAVLALEPGESEWQYLAHNGKNFPVPGGAGIQPALSFPAVRADDGRIGFSGGYPPTYGLYVLETPDSFERTMFLDGSPNFDNESAMASSGDYAVATRRVFSTYTSIAIRGRLGTLGPTIVESGDVLTFDNAPGQWVFSPEYRRVRINGSGQMILFGTVRDANAPGAQELTAAVRLSDSGARLLAREGDSVPGLPGLTWSGQQQSASARLMVLSDTGDSAWWLGLAGPGIDATNDTVLALFSGGEDATMTIVGREGSSVPDLPGAVYSGSFAPTMHYGRLAFTAGTRLQGDFSTPSRFVIDGSGRARMQLKDNYSSVLIPGLGQRTVTLTLAQNGSGGNDGQRRRLSADGSTTMVVRYADGQAVIVLPTPCPADIAATGGVPGYDGVTDNNDFVVFIDLFFNSDPRADRGSVGGMLGSDGLFDNNDFVVFINEFFNGCE